MHQITLICDYCEKNYSLEDEMEIPPYWFAVQVAIANQYGLVPNHERDKFMHFCSQECLASYAASPAFRERICLVDKEYDEEQPQ